MWFFPSPFAAKRPMQRERSRGFRPQVEALEERWCPTGGKMEWADPLDPTFGNGGIVVNNFGSSSQALTDVVALPNGKLLAAGYFNGDFAAARYNADGSFDTSFGSGGLATVDFKGLPDSAMAMAVLPDGKILLAGRAFVVNGQGQIFGVVRLNPNGTLDTTFGSKGKATATPAPRVGNFASSMAVQPDGKIVLAGLAMNLGSSGSGSIALARFNANGSLDNSFGNKGTVLTTIAADRGSSLRDHDVNVAVDGSGRIVVSATTAYPTYDFLVTRFNGNGSLDTTFGAANTGVVTTDLAAGSTDMAYSLTLQGDGKIVVGGFASSNVADPIPVPATLVRYNPNGTLDGSFDGDGIVTAVWDVGPGHASSAVTKAVVVQPDGKLLIAANGHRYTLVGGGYENDYRAILLMRFNPDGSPDLSYGPTGTRAVATSWGFNSGVAAMDVQPDGRVVVVGGMNTDEPNYLESFALARFFESSGAPSPVQIGSLLASATTVAAGSPLTLTAGNITSTNAGATITRVAFYAVDDSGAEWFLGYATANGDGTWALTFTVGLEPGAYTLLALAVDSTGAISDPFLLDLEVV